MAGIEVVDPRYRALYDRFVEVLGGDERIARVEITGSVARGTADRWSDLDLAVVTAPESFEEVLGEWPQWLASITPTVFARTPLAPFVINTVTDDGLTLDIAVYGGSVPEFPTPGGYTVGMLSGRRFDDVGAALEHAVAEQLRGLAGPFVSLVQRDEHMKHLTGVPHILGLLTTVFLAETGAAPPAKHWNRTFTEEQRDAVAALPPVAATRESIVDFGLEVARLVVDRSRPLFPRYGLEWPAAFAAVTARRLREELDIEAADWLW